LLGDSVTGTFHGIAICRMGPLMLAFVKYIVLSS
jgi:hypothetical protein